MSERHAAPAVALLATRLLAPVLLVACSGGPPPQELPPQTVSRSAPTADAEPPPAPSPPEPRKPLDVTIEPVEPESEEEPTLVEAARRERDRRRSAEAPIAVITDANLHEHAVGQLTFLEEEEAETAAEAGKEEAGAMGDAEVELAGRDEAYWRERVRALRERWRAAADRVPELEDRAAALRRRFYETDDAYYRDTRIKPAWDRAIDLIAQSRAAADAYHLELVATLDEGRRAGALPGWLREGIELEPEPAEPEREVHEPGEPRILGEDDPGGGP